MIQDRIKLSERLEKVWANNIVRETLIIDVIDSKDY